MTPTPTALTTVPKPGPKIEREARLRWVPIEKMRVSPVAQRDLNVARVDKIAANLDLEQLGAPTVNERGGLFYIIDGQHRIEALKAMGWGDQQIQCWTYAGLTEAEEAERFLLLNDTLAVDAFSRFRVGVRAGRTVEVDIDRVVRAQGLCISRQSVPGAIGSVGTLVRIYNRSNASVLARTLRIIRDAYGDGGLQATIIDGVALVCARYSGLDDSAVISRLSKANGGVNGLVTRAEVLHKSTGQPKGHCTAAAAVDILNAGRGGLRIASWWKEA